MLQLSPKRLTRRRYLEATAAVLSVSVAGCTDRTQSILVSDDVALDDHELVRANEGGDHETARVVGTVRNEDNSAQSVRVTVVFYDDNGDRVDESERRIRELQSDGTWSFAVTYPGTGDDARAIEDYDITVETT